MFIRSSLANSLAKSQTNSSPSKYCITSEVGDAACVAFGSAFWVAIVSVPPTGVELSSVS